MILKFLTTIRSKIISTQNTAYLFRSSRLFSTQYDIVKINKLEQDYSKLYTSFMKPFSKKSKKFCNKVGVGKREIENYSDKVHSLSKLIQKALQTKPNPKVFERAIQPKSLKSNIKLNDHQLYTIEWIKWREKTNPKGAILSDEIGTGKKLSILNYLASKKTFSNDSLKTLIVMSPFSIDKWIKEIEDKFNEDTFSYLKYSFNKRSELHEDLSRYDIVFTTYGTLSNYFKAQTKNNVNKSKFKNKMVPKLNIKWNCLILDEAHRIRDYSNNINKAVCKLRADFRIAVTCTPIHNSLYDFYSLIKFLRLKYFYNLNYWKLLIPEEMIGIAKEQIKIPEIIDQITDLFISQRKNTLSSTQKEVKLIPIMLDYREKLLHDVILKHYNQKINKILVRLPKRKTINPKNRIAYDPISYMVRLRQSCCHFNLLREAISTEEIENLKQENQIESIDELFEPNYLNSKCKLALSLTENLVRDYPNDKLLIVSQWKSFLDIFKIFLEEKQLDHYEINGKVGHVKRKEIINSFNNQKNADKNILLMTISINNVDLVSANRLILLDNHWNPFVEKKLFSRISQSKNTEIYKFICKDTIEEYIDFIQQNKLKLSDLLLNENNVHNI